MMQVMAERGYERASMPEVAKAAGLTQGLIHYHFKNKQEILLSALEELTRRQLDRLDGQLGLGDADPWTQLTRFIELHLALGTEADPEAAACWMVISGEALRQAAVRVAFQASVGELIGRLLPIIEAGNAQGAFRCEDPGAAAGAILATIQGYFVLAATAREQIPKGSAARSTRQMAAALVNGTEPTGEEGGSPCE